MENENHDLTKVIPIIAHAPQVAQGYNNYGSEINEEMHFRDYWDILVKRKWIVISFLVIVVTFVYLMNTLMTPIYRAATILQITQDNPSALISDRDPFSAFALTDYQGRFYETQYLILHSRPMAYRIIDALNLQERPDYQAISKGNPQLTEEQVKGAYADRLLNSLEVKPLKRSYLVEISFKSPDKKLAWDVVNVISREYVKLSMNTRHQSYDLIKNWLETELQALAQRVETSERKVYEYGQKKEFLALEGRDKEGKNSNTIIQKYLDLSNLLTKAQAERVAKEAQYRQIQEKGLDAPIVVNNPLIGRLREDFIKQEAKVSSLNKIYDENYPTLQAERGSLKELQKRLNVEVQRVKTSTAADFEAAQRTEKLLKEAYETQKTKVIELQGNLVQHHILRRDLETNEQLFQALLARMKEANVASTMVASNIAVISPPEKPFSPFSPQKRYNIMIGVLIGLLGGIGLAYLSEYFDDSIKTSEELERVCRFPTLGVVPLQHEQHKGERPKVSETALLTLTQTDCMLSEAIRHVRTSVMFSSSGGPPEVIMVTSPNPSEGKTTVSINLAVSLALSGAKVALMDADLRNPTLHRVFQQPLHPGLTNYITGAASPEEIRRVTEIPNLTIISAGNSPPNPGELLSSKMVEDFITSIRKDFDHVIIDTPPIIGFADGRNLSTLTDGVIVIIKHHSTTREAGRLAKKLLSAVNARVIGGVLNMTVSNKLGYGSYYGYYKYYYKAYGKYNKNNTERLES